MISAAILGGEQLIAKLNSITPKLRENLRVDLQTFLIDMQTYIKVSKLSAPEGYSPDQLHHITGNLIRSIHWDIEDTDKGVVGSEAVGQEAPYGKVHEYGGTFNRISTLGKPFAQTYPERSFMRTSLKELQPKFSDLVRKAVREALNA